MCHPLLKCWDNYHCIIVLPVSKMTSLPCPCIPQEKGELGSDDVKTLTEWAIRATNPSLLLVPGFLGGGAKHLDGRLF